MKRYLLTLTLTCVALATALTLSITVSAQELVISPDPLSTPIQGTPIQDQIIQPVQDAIGCIDESKINPRGICGAVYIPVCGCDGKTYGNSCEACKAGVTSWTKGECGKSVQPVPEQVVIPGQPLLPTQPGEIVSNPYFFGMNVSLIRSQFGTPSLRVDGVVNGSPAAKAGLELGDEIISINGRGLDGAQDSFQAVRLMNQFVIVQGPALDASLVQPSIPIAQLVVRNVRNDQYVGITVYPSSGRAVGL